jgi:hypothetical protein
MSTKSVLSGGLMVSMAALVPITECGVAMASCGYEVGSADLSKCDEDGPGQHGREIFVQVVTASISTGSIGGTYGGVPPVLQVIDAHHVPPPDRWSPIATEPSATPRPLVTLYGSQAVDLELVKGLFKT